jgi:phenylacetate 2-hydroxylase
MHEILQAFAASVALLILYRYFNSTDLPKIKNLPEIPGVPVFGNLLQLGNNHAQVAAKWAKKYGPVFQVRMGNKASIHFLFFLLFVLADTNLL